MAQPLPFVLDVLDVSEAPGDEDSQEPSPYDEREVHDSFHQLIQEQVAREGLELQDRAAGAAGSGHHTLPGPGGTVVHSTATLRILASMPSRTIGEWDSALGDAGPRAGLPAWPGAAARCAGSLPQHGGECRPLGTQQSPRSLGKDSPGGWGGPAWPSPAQLPS